METFPVDSSLGSGSFPSEHESQEELLGIHLMLMLQQLWKDGQRDDALGAAPGLCASSHASPVFPFVPYGKFQAHCSPGLGVRTDGVGPWCARGTGQPGKTRQMGLEQKKGIDRNAPEHYPGSGERMGSP